MQSSMFSKYLAHSLTSRTLQWIGPGRGHVHRLYSSERKRYDLFGSIRGKARPGDAEFRRALDDAGEEDGAVWTGSEGEDGDYGGSRLRREMKEAEEEAEANSVRIDADDSDQLRWGGSDSDRSLWTGGEEDSEADAPTDPFPNPASDRHLDKLFEAAPAKGKYSSFSEAVRSAEAEGEAEAAEDMAPGRQARRAAVEAALRKLRKGPDGRYVNVWEVMSDVDVLIGAFENIVSGPEYEEMRKAGPRKLDMAFFRDVQAKMRDPNYRFSPEYKLRPKSRLVPKGKWQKAEAKRRKAAKR